MAAMTVALLYIASVFPTGQLGFVAVTSLFTIAVVIEAGLVYGILVYVCCAVLAFLIVPLKGAAILYALFFGYYAVIKSIAERMKTKALSWAFKEIVFLAALSVVWLVFRSVVFSPERAAMSTLPVYIAGLVVFTVYDIGLTRLIGYYMARISPKINRK